MDETLAGDLAQLRDHLHSGADEASVQLAYVRGLFASLPELQADDRLPIDDIIPTDLDYARHIATSLQSRGLDMTRVLALLAEAVDAVDAASDWTPTGLSEDPAFDAVRALCGQALDLLPNLPSE